MEYWGNGWEWWRDIIPFSLLLGFFHSWSTSQGSLPTDKLALTWWFNSSTWIWCLLFRLIYSHQWLLMNLWALDRSPSNKRLNVNESDTSSVTNGLMKRGRWDYNCFTVKEDWHTVNWINRINAGYPDVKWYWLWKLMLFRHHLV